MRRDLKLPLLLLALVLVNALATAPSSYYLLRPGGAYEIGPILEIPAEQRQDSGRLAFTAVRAGVGSWWQVAEARLLGNAEIVPAEEFLPSGMSIDELNRQNQRLIDESKLVASVVGLQAAGYDARVTGQGAEVAGALVGLPADGLLQPGDLIVAVDGRATETAPAVVEAVRRHQVGDRVGFSVLRGNERLELVIGTRGASNEPARPIVGVSVSTYRLDAQLPFPVSIDTSNVGGPSAGLMFALAILDAVTPGDLTGGRFVAGTGTIASDGSVGPIGGAAEKVVAAERAGAALFVVPRQNESEARRGARAIQVLPVDRFSDALHQLCALAPTDSPQPSGSPCLTR